MAMWEENPFNDVAYRMDAEGFNYCFNGYSSWDNIKDEEFHRLRLEYLEAAQKLRSYVYSKSDEGDY